MRKIYVIFLLLLSGVCWGQVSTNGITVAGGNGYGSAANQLDTPSGLYVDIQGDVYIADANNNRIQKWTPGATQGITVAGGNGYGSAANQLKNPQGIFIDSNNNIFIADSFNNRIQKWTPGATQGITIAGGNGQGSAANQLYNPKGIFIDSNNNIYIADASNNRIQKWTLGATQGITVAGGNGQGNAANQLYLPQGIFIDSNNNLFIADSFNNRIQKWTLGATQGITVAGGNGQGSAANQFYYPYGIFVDDSNNLCIVDAINNRVQKWTLGETYGNTIAGVSWAGNGANELYSPRGIFIDISGNLFVSDTYNHRVQKFSSTDPNLMDISIVNLSESINKASYTVPREATVHHYFLAKKTSNNTPIKNVVLKYTIGTDPTIRTSLPSGNDGLIDLNITVGGTDPNNQADDWIPKTGTLSLNTYYPVQFLSLAVGTITGTNAFTPFQLKVIDKAQPDEKEYGFAFSLGAGTGLEFGKDVKIGNLKLKAGIASLKGGKTSGPHISINPISQDLWRIRLGADKGLYVAASVGPQISILNKIEAGTALEVGVDYGVRNEAEFEVNLNDNNQLFKMASSFLLLRVGDDPRLKMASSLFKNLSNAALPAKGEAFTSSIGFSGNLSLNLGISTQLANFGGYRKYTDVEFGVGAFVEGSVNLENSFEKTESGESSSSTTLSAGAEANVAIQGLGSIVDEAIVLNHLPFKILNASISNDIVMTKEFDSQGNLSNSNLSFSSEKGISILSNQQHNVKYIQNYTYSPTVVQFLKNRFSSVPSLSNNSFASFLAVNRSLPKSLWRSYPDETSFYKQLLDLHTFTTQNAQNSWGLNDIKLSTNREITLINSVDNFSVDVSAGITLQIPITFESWNTYSHKFQEAVYSKSLSKRLITTDYPEVFNNLEIPQTEPITYFWNKVEEKVNQVATNVVQEAYGFVTEVFTSIIDQIKIYTNLNQPRKSLAGAVIYDPNSKNTQSSSSTPSVFTFTVNPSPAVFSNTTSIKFKYYYPQNEINAITVSDTFRVISDVFFLEAKDGNTVINQAPNGNFTVSTQFSQVDLALASLPSNSSVKVLFLPNNSSIWEVISNADLSFNFNRLGVFAIGVKISNDDISPTISVVPPSNFSSTEFFSVTLSDNQTGIDWAKTIFSSNGTIIPYSRIDNTNTFQVQMSSIPSNPDNIFNITIMTSDLAGNVKNFTNTYPCISELNVQSVLSDINNPITKKASQKVESNAKLPTSNDVIFRAGGSIELKSGFEARGTKTFKAEIGGCTSNPLIPTNGLVAYYPFNGNANDESGNGNHGIDITAQQQPDRRNNNDSKSYLFSTATQIIKILPSTTLQFSNQFSFSVWLKNNGSQNENGFNIFNRTSCCNYPTYLGLVFIKNDIEIPAVNVSTHNLGTWVQESPYNFKQFYGNDLANTNGWNLFTVTYLNGVGKTYQNGILTSTTVIQPISFANTNSLNIIIGGSSSSSSGYNRQLDDFRIYNRALTDAEVLQIYNAEKP